MKSPSPEIIYSKGVWGAYGAASRWVFHADLQAASFEQEDIAPTTLVLPDPLAYVEAPKVVVLV